MLFFECSVLGCVCLIYRLFHGDIANYVPNVFAAKIEIHKSSMPVTLKKRLINLCQHWSTLVVISYIFLSVIQTQIIMPIEQTIIDRNVAVVSLLYLPHAVRVLAAWLIGPRVIFVLIPASFMVSLVSQADIGALTQADIIIPLVGALCAPLAFELMRIVRIDVYPKEDGVISWRTLIFAGFLSSILNSFFSTFFMEGRFLVEDTFDILTQFIVGDVMGLVLTMLFLVGMLKCVRRTRNV